MSLVAGEGSLGKICLVKCLMMVVLCSVYWLVALFFWFGFGLVGCVVVCY